MSRAVYALYPLRITLAAVFLVYGVDKFRNLDGTADMFESWGIPLPAVSVFLVATAEVLGGLSLFVGVLPRFSAAVLSVVMLTAMFVVKFDVGFQGGWAFDLALLGGLLTMVVNGAGRPTLLTVWQELRDRRAAARPVAATA